MALRFLLFLTRAPSAVSISGATSSSRAALGALRRETSRGTRCGALPALAAVPLKALSVLALLTVQLLTAPLFADERIRFHTYGAEDGLAGEPIYSVLQDHEGYLWVGSEGGLDRFDGHRFEPFRYDERTPGSLPGLRALSLLEDHLGRLWVGTENGPAIYDREEKSFQPVTLPASDSADQEANESPQVEAMFLDRRKTLWFGTDRGLFRLALGVGRPQTEDIRRAFDGLVPGSPDLADPRVKTFAEDGAGRLWIGTRGGLVRLDSVADRPRVDRFVHEPSDPGSLHDDEVYTLRFDRGGDLWIGTWGTGGLGKLSADQLAAERPRFQRFVYPDEDPRGIPLDVVKSLLEDRDGNLWIGTQEVGVCLLSADERRRAEPHFRCLPHDPLDPTSPPRSPLVDIAEDAQGNVWLAGQTGLVRHVPATAKIALIHPRPEPGASARSIGVNSSWEMKDGTIWVGTGEGLERVTVPDRPGEAVRIERFLHDPEDAESLASNWVYVVLGDRRQNLWVGTVRGALHRLTQDRPRPRFQRFYGGDSGLTTPTIFSLFEDASGVLWVGTYLGLFHSRAALGSESPVFQKLDPAVGTLTSELIYSTFEDQQQRLWIGTDLGLDRLSADRTRLEKEILQPGLVVLQATLGPNGHLWMTSDSEGLISVDPETDRWRSWKLTLGAETHPLSVSTDSLGRIWTATKRRLFRLEPQTAEVRVFGQRDGLRILPFREQSLRLGSSGRFFLGGANGLAVFYPEELSHAPLLEPVVLRSLQIANEDVDVGPDGPLPQSLETLETLVLQPDEQTFSLEFAALTYHRQEEVRYAYRLRGYSDEWIESDSDRRRATFTNLSPGDYTFEVKARGDVGSWGPHPAALKLRILPEWYEKNLVRALILAFSLGLPLLWIWFRFRRVEAHRRELQSLVDRWQMERRQRRRWQDLSVTAAQLAQQIRGPLELIQHRTRAASGEDTATESDPSSRHLAAQLLKPVEEATTKLEELVSFVVQPRPETGPVDLGTLIESLLLELSSKIQAAGLTVRHQLHGTRILANRDLLAQILEQVIESRLEHAEPGDSLRFSFENEGASGRLRIEGSARPGDRKRRQSQSRNRMKSDESGDGSGSFGLGLAEKLALQHNWTMDIETGDRSSTRIDLSGLRLS